MKSSQITYVFILFLLKVNVYADTWSLKANFPGIKREGEIAFSIGSKGYLGFGFQNDTITSRNLKDFWEYDPSFDTWTQKATLPDSGRVGSVGFSINNKGYVCSGYDYPSTNNFWEYDPLTNSWTAKANFGGVYRGWLTGFSIGTKAYVGTGEAYNPYPYYLNDFWVWDQVTDIWSQLPNLTGIYRASAVGFSINGKGYICTGNHGSIYLNDTWEFDPIFNTWTQMADFPDSGRTTAFGFSLCDKGYLGGGVNNHMTLRDFWQFDPSLNHWIQKATLPGTIRRMQIGFSINNKGYMALGDDSAGYNHIFSDLWEYTPDSSCNTGQSEIANSFFKINLFPNPATEKLSIIASTNIFARIKIWDLNGILVYKELINTNGNTIDVSKWKSGIYFYEAGYDKETTRGKFIIEK